ncbi:MAG: ATP-binding cassette domain-containing protein [Fibrobacteria bacterium]|nr:ATP-binding cassette domain-containing protein [Fibrobacteria bacterium]
MKRGLTCSLRKRLRSAHGNLDLEIELSVEPGERVAIFGPSGSGKSSILRMLAGLLPPDEGFISVGETAWFDSSRGIDVPTHRRIPGLVFQDHALFPHRTAFQNILDGIPKDDKFRHSVASEFLERFELGGVADHLPSRLSGGQSQRVALARTLASRPATLLLDEPLAALDSALRGRMIEEIASQLEKVEHPTILVSHDMGEVWRLAHRVVRLEEGRVVARGTPGEVFAGGKSTPRLRIPAIVLALEESEGLVVVTADASGEIARAVVSLEEAATLRTGQTILLAAKGFETMVLPTLP